MKKLIALVCLLLAFSCSQETKKSPTLILLNGKIFTAENLSAFTEAVAIRGNTIIATGNTDDIKKLVGGSTQVIEEPPASVESPSDMTPAELSVMLDTGVWVDNTAQPGVRMAATPQPVSTTDAPRQGEDVAFAEPPQPGLSSGKRGDSEGARDALLAPRPAATAIRSARSGIDAVGTPVHLHHPERGSDAPFNLAPGATAPDLLAQQQTSGVPARPLPESGLPTPQTLRFAETPAAMVPQTTQSTGLQKPEVVSTQAVAAPRLPIDRGIAERGSDVAGRDAIARAELQSLPANVPGQQAVATESPAAAVAVRVDRSTQQLQQNQPALASAPAMHGETPEIGSRLASVSARMSSIGTPLWNR